MQRLRLQAAMAVICVLPAGCRSTAAPRSGPIRRPAVKLPRPIARHSPKVVVGERITPAVHHGARLPARAALAVGEETWLATPSGIVRLSHGERVGTIDVGAGLCSPSINALWLRRDGQVLAATDDGISRLTPDGKVVAGTILDGSRVTALAPPLVGTWRGLYLLDAKNQPRLVVGTTSLQIVSLLRCGDSTFVGTHAAGLHRYRRGKLEQLVGVPTTARVGDISGCGPSWAATTSGLFRIERGRATAVDVWKSHATTVEAIKDHVVVGTFGEGVFKLLAKADSEISWLARSGRVSLLARSGGSLLVGTEERLLWIDDSKDPREIELPGPPPGLITALAHDGKRLWAGSFDAGLRVHHDDTWRRVPLEDPRVTALATDRLARVWIGTAKGLSRASADGTPSPVTDPRGWLRGRHINALRARGDTIIAAAHPGFVVIRIDGAGKLDYRYFGAAGKDSDVGISAPTVYGVAFADADTLWLATTGGATRLQAIQDKQQARWMTDIDGVLPDNWLNDVRATSNAVHLLTLRDGLISIAPRRGTTVWQLKLMTSPSVLRALDDTLLFGTNARGLALLSTAEEKPRVRTFGPRQGLSSSLVGALLIDREGDRVWIGGNGGIDRIDNLSELVAMKERK